MMVQQLLSNARLLYPDAAALVHEDRTLTFEELGSASDTLAAYLQKEWEVTLLMRSMMPIPQHWVKMK